MDKKGVVLVVPTGRRKNLEILIPYIHAARKHFDRCELWMNATWEPDDREYAYGIPAQYPGVFLLKDDGDWDVRACFSHYGRYYHTLAKDDTIYIKLDDDICWMAPDAIESLIESRKANPNPLIVVANTVNNTFCNTKHKELGIYPQFDLIRSCHCPVGHYSSEFIDFAHTAFLKAIAEGTTDSYRFKDETTYGIRTPNHMFAFYGRDIKWDTDDEAYITATLANEQRPVLMAGYPLVAHISYDGQLPHVYHNTDFHIRYKELVPPRVTC